MWKIKHEISVYDFIEHFLMVFIVEGWQSGQHLKEKYTEAVNVDSAVVTFTWL